MLRERYIVPLTLSVTLLLVLLLTISWVQRPYQGVQIYITMGPPHVTVGRAYGLRFTPRNRVSGHIWTTLVSAQRHCVPVTIVNRNLSYFDAQQACRLPDGSYKLPYTFPKQGIYTLFIEMQPVGGDSYVERKVLDLRDPLTCHNCAPPAHLQNMQDIRLSTTEGLTIVLGISNQAVEMEHWLTVPFVILSQQRVRTDLQPINGAPGTVVAISSDLLHLVRFSPQPGQVHKGRVTTGTVDFRAWFGRAGTYKIFATFKHANKPIQASFVMGVNPLPTPTPNPNN